jgi:hypothetical protein
MGCSRRFTATATERYTSSTNYSRIRNNTVTQLNGYWEISAMAPNDGAYVGVRARTSASDWIDFHSFVHASGYQVSYGTGTSSASASETSGSFPSNAWHAQRMRMTNGATRTMNYWIDRVLKLGPDFNFGAGNTGAGGIGFLMYAGLGCSIRSAVMFTTGVISVNGLSGTMGFQVEDNAGGVIGSSGAQTAGTATYDGITTMNFPHNGKIKVYSDAPTYSDLLATFPDTGTDLDICGGDAYHYTAA